MFFEMFSASALAVILFSKDQNEKDYSNQFSSIERKLDSVIDTQKFMKARLSLMEFNTKLIGEPTLTLENHSYESIMDAAKEGFQKLLDAAYADENNYKSARVLFDNTYGNIDWVKEKFSTKVKEIEDFIREYESNKEELESSRKLIKKYYSLKWELKYTSKIRFIKIRKIKKELSDIENLPTFSGILNNPMVAFHAAKRRGVNPSFTNSVMQDIIGGIPYDPDRYKFTFIIENDAEYLAVMKILYNM